MCFPLHFWTLINFWQRLHYRHDKAENTVPETEASTADRLWSLNGRDFPDDGDLFTGFMGEKKIYFC